MQLFVEQTFLQSLWSLSSVSPSLTQFLVPLRDLLNIHGSKRDWKLRRHDMGPWVDASGLPLIAPSLGPAKSQEDEQRELRCRPDLTSLASQVHAGPSEVVSSPSALTPPQTYRMPETASDLWASGSLIQDPPLSFREHCAHLLGGQDLAHVRVPCSCPADHAELNMRVYEQVLARDFRTPRQWSLSRVGVRARRPRPAPTAFGRGRRLGRTHIAVG